MVFSILTRCPKEYHGIQPSDSIRKMMLVHMAALQKNMEQDNDLPIFSCYEQPTLLDHRHLRVFER